MQKIKGIFSRLMFWRYKYAKNYQQLFAGQEPKKSNIIYINHNQ